MKADDRLKSLMTHDKETIANWYLDLLQQCQKRDENYYKKEFVEWILRGNNGTFIQSHHTQNGGMVFIGMVGESNSLDQVYEDWKINIKDKQ